MDAVLELLEAKASFLADFTFPAMCERRLTCTLLRRMHFLRLSLGLGRRSGRERRSSWLFRRRGSRLCNTAHGIRTGWCFRELVGKRHPARTRRFIRLDQLGWAFARLRPGRFGNSLQGRFFRCFRRRYSCSGFSGTCLLCHCSCDRTVRSRKSRIILRFDVRLGLLRFWFGVPLFLAARMLSPARAPGFLCLLLHFVVKLLQPVIVRRLLLSEQKAQSYQENNDDTGNDSYSNQIHISAIAPFTILARAPRSVGNPKFLQTSVLNTKRGRGKTDACVWPNEIDTLTQLWSSERTQR